MYHTNENGISYDDQKGEVVFLSNFTAQITEEIRYVDGKSQSTVLTITGHCRKKNLPAIRVAAKEFPSLSWVLNNWGVGPVISAVPNAERHLRNAIQSNSDPKKKTIYTHTGWTTIDGVDAYLTAAGAITAKGQDSKVSVELPNELSRFSILPNDNKVADAIDATISLSQLGPKQMMWPLIAGTVRPPIGPVDYGIHISGQTGTFKSEISSLLQSHYGSEMDARHLPGSWSSTANALEAQAYRCKNAVFCIDDFVPTGSSWQVKALQKTADQIIRAQGNQSGRARLTDVSSHQTTMFPRGMILSTGEDIPTNHSIRARLLIIDLTPGEVSKTRLSNAQADRYLYPICMAGWIQWLAALGVEKVQIAHEKRRNKIRDENQDVGHTRTPATLGDLQTTIQLFLGFALQKGKIGKKMHAFLLHESFNAIMACCSEQERHLKSADPTETFVETIRAIITGNQAHLRATDGGIPRNPTELGWTESRGIDGIPTYKANGPKMGWVDWDKDECLLDAASAYQLIVRHSRGAISQTKQTMLKRLKDQGLLSRTDEGRQRNTVRVTCEGGSKHVLAMRLSHILDSQEQPQ